MNIYGQLTLIAAVVCFVIDYSGWTDTWKGWLHIDEGRRVKPLDCSLCMTFWTGSIYLLCVGEFTLAHWAYACLLAAMNKPIGGLLHLLRYGLETAIRNANKWLDKVNHF